MVGDLRMWLYRANPGNPRQMRRRRPLSANDTAADGLAAVDGDRRARHVVRGDARSVAAGPRLRVALRQLPNRPGIHQPPPAPPSGKLGQAVSVCRATRKTATFVFG